MPGVAGRIRVLTAGQTLQLTSLQSGGTNVPMFTDSALSSQVTFPLAGVNADTTYYVDAGWANSDLVLAVQTSAGQVLGPYTNHFGGPGHVALFAPRPTIDQLLAEASTGGGASNLGDPVTVPHGGTGAVTLPAQLLKGAGTGVVAGADLTGDVTTSGGLATALASGAVSLAKMANLAANSILGNNTGSPATPAALTMAQVLAALSGAATSAFSLNSQKITALANGSAAQDAAAFGQIPLVGAASDITLPGTKAAGASGKYADAAHVHSREFIGGYLPADYGYTAWSYDPIQTGGGTILSAGGTVTGVRLWLPAMTVTNIIMHVTTGGATLTAGQCFAGLFNDATNPVLLSATADQATAWQSAGVKTMALSAAQAISAGFYNIAFFANGTTLPTFARGSNVSAVALNLLLASPHLRGYTADTARTTTFATPMGAQTGINVVYFAAVS